MKEGLSAFAVVWGLGIAMLAASLLAGASAATAAERESVSLKVDAASVNFADPASVAALRRQAERVEASP